MKVLFGGVRGSAPQTGPEYALFGGHTTSLLVTGQQGEQVVLDLGSGVQVLNPELKDAAPSELLILLTHLHLDHILGLPWLQAFYESKCHIRIMAGGYHKEKLAHALSKVASPPLWPIALADMGARISLEDHSAASKTFTWGGLQISGAPIAHPGGCFAWRIDEPKSGTSLVFATDIEWTDESCRSDPGLVPLCQSPHPADLLIMDGHFFDDELPEHRGLGHSSVGQCIEEAQSAGAKRLLVTHHNPKHRDKDLSAIEQKLSQEVPGASLARQGQVFDLDSLKNA